MQKDTGYMKEDSAGQENIFAVEVQAPFLSILTGLVLKDTPGFRST